MTSRDRSSQLYCSDSSVGDGERASFRSTRRCDFCGGHLGLIIHRYYRMRFCCESHMAAYRERLTEETRAKIQRLASVGLTERLGETP
jgi:hypothetical protein